jgi:hypothetical protein
MSWAPNGDPLSRDAYTVRDSFVAENGRTYLEVEVKGIGQTKYLSRTGGPGRSISRDWYNEKKRDKEPDNDVVKITATCKYETRYRNQKHGMTSTKAKIEITGIFDKSDAPTDEQVKRKMRGLQKQANQQLPFVQDCTPNIDTDDYKTNIEKRGWQLPKSELTLDMEHAAKEYDYTADPEQTQIESFGDNA